MRIYLDQNHWIGLLKAKAGGAGGARFDPALVLLREAVARGDVSLPLSHVHQRASNPPASVAPSAQAA